MKTMLVLLLCLALLVPVYTAAGESAYKTITEIYRIPDGRSTTNPVEIKFYIMVSSRKIREAYDYATAQLSDLMARLPISAWDGTLCYCSEEERVLYGLLLPDKKISSEYSEYPSLLYLLGYVLVEIGQKENALKYFTLAFDMDPLMTGACKEITNCYLSLHEYEKGKEKIDYTRSLCVTIGDIGWYYRRLGFVQYELGNAQLSKYLQLYSLRFEDIEITHNELKFRNGV
jgi:tetratricopeptide (TPR) repeat protein